MFQICGLVFDIDLEKFPSLLLQVCLLFLSLCILLLGFPSRICATFCSCSRARGDSVYCLSVFFSLLFHFEHFHDRPASSSSAVSRLLRSPSEIFISLVTVFFSLVCLSESFLGFLSLGSQRVGFSVLSTLPLEPLAFSPQLCRTPGLMVQHPCHGCLGLLLVFSSNSAICLLVGLVLVVLRAKGNTSGERNS